MHRTEPRPAALQLEKQRHMQLPTPTSSPEPEPQPDDEVLSSAAEDLPHASTLERQFETSIHDEVLLSDTGEKKSRIKRPGDARRSSSVTDHDKMLKLSPRQIQELTSEPASIPVRAATPILEDALEDALAYAPAADNVDAAHGNENKILGLILERPIPAPTLTPRARAVGEESQQRANCTGEVPLEKELVLVKTSATDFRKGRPTLSSRSVTSPALVRRPSSRSRSRTHSRIREDASVAEEKKLGRHVHASRMSDQRDMPSKSLPYDNHRDHRDCREALPVLPVSLPLPPLSMPTFLSLELSASRPSPLYIYRPATTDFPYESSDIKYQRLLNFLQIPLKIESILGFGALACLDAWMHVLTILPLRFLLALAILVKWWGSVIVKEFRDLWAFVYSGLPRVWRRRKHNDVPTPLLTPSEEEPLASPQKTSSTVSSAIASSKPDNAPSATFKFPDARDSKTRRLRNSRFRHRRTKSTPSTLLPSHKADILKGLLVVASCFVLMRFDASRMYHGIRGQSAIKLYVIYNVLEVCDRLLSAVGQDVLECLFSRETLDRNPDGRSKVLRPLGMFTLALLYTVAHATALFYQVITLNVAVNSYSNALLTLLMSNQFVEIKGTVFKKFEKENLFQITCADIVERFQLWLMLLIIAMRNVVEVGGLSIRSSEASWTAMFTTVNATASTSFTASNIIPMSFTIFPKYIAQVLNPFLLVLGSEMFVDWLKHAYITKFNQYKPDVYGKFFDVLAKDYYSDVGTWLENLVGRILT